MSIMAIIGFIFNVGRGNGDTTSLFFGSVVDVSIILKFGVTFFGKNYFSSMIKYKNFKPFDLI